MAKRIQLLIAVNVEVEDDTPDEIVEKVKDVLGEINDELIQAGDDEWTGRFADVIDRTAEAIGTEVEWNWEIVADIEEQEVEG